MSIFKLWYKSTEKQKFTYLSWCICSWVTFHLKIKLGRRYAHNADQMHLVCWRKRQLNEQRELILKLTHCARAILAPHEIPFIYGVPTPTLVIPWQPACTKVLLPPLEHTASWNPCGPITRNGPGKQERRLQTWEDAKARGTQTCLPGKPRGTKYNI